MHRLKRWIAPLAAALVTFVTCFARADVGTFSLEYEVDPACPSRDDFVSEITRRTPRARYAASGAITFRFRVAIARQSGRSSTGKIEIREEDDARSVREVSGQTCAEVVSGLALIAALALDPEASLAPIEPQPALPPPSPPKPAKPDIVVPPPAPHPLPVAPSPRRLRGVAGIDVGGTLGLLPVVQAIGSVAIGLEWSRAGSLRAALEYGLPTTIGTEMKTARVDWLAGRIEGCAAGLNALGRLWFGACGGLSAGRIAGTGLAGGGIVTPRAGRWPWLAALVAAQVQVDLDRFAVRLEGGPLVPFYRETFHFDEPTVTIHRVTAVVGFAQVGVGVRFP